MKRAEATGELRLRITVENPVEDVAMQVQRGRNELLPPSAKTPRSISFDFPVRVGPSKNPGTIRFLGEYTQGPPAARSGRLASPS